MRMRDGLSSRSPESTRGDETVGALYVMILGFFRLSSLVIVYVSEFFPLQTLRHEFSPS